MVSSVLFRPASGAESFRPGASTMVSSVLPHSASGAEAFRPGASTMVTSVGYFVSFSDDETAETVSGRTDAGETVSEDGFWFFFRVSFSFMTSFHPSAIPRQSR